MANNVGNEAEGLKKEDQKKYGKAVVHFRPHEQWKGEYGFDWIRKKSEKIKTRLNNERGNDYDTKKIFFSYDGQPKNDNLPFTIENLIDENRGILGEYINTGCSKSDPCDFDSLQYCRHPNNTSSICFDTNSWSWVGNDTGVTNSDLFRQTANMGDLSYGCFEHIWVWGTGQYTVPILSIMPNETITIKLRVLIIENPLEKGFFFKSNPDVFEIDKDNKIKGIDITKISTTSNDADYQKIDITIKCLKNITENEYIEIYYDDEKTEDSSKICGRLKVIANSKINTNGKDLQKIDVVFVEVTTDIGNGTQTAIFENDYSEMFFNAFRQACIKYDNEIVKLNLIKKEFWPPWRIFQDNKFKRMFSFKKEIKEETANKNQGSDVALLHFLNEELNKQYNNKYTNYFKVYIIKEVYPNTNGFSHPSIKNCCIVFKGHSPSTVPHELMHALGLSHTFTANNMYGWSPNAIHTYKAVRTDNIMDYSHWEHINRFSTFFWQWKILWKSLEEINNG